MKYIFNTEEFLNEELRKLGAEATYKFTKNESEDKKHNRLASKDKDGHSWKRVANKKSGSKSLNQKFVCKCGYSKEVENDENEKVTITYSLKKFNESEFSKRDNESADEWLERLDVEFKRSSSNIKKTFSDMKKDGVVAFCKECGCNIYKDIEHICGEINEGDEYKRGTKPPKDPNEITAEDIISDFMKKTGLSKEESLKLLDEFSEKLKKVKSK